MTMIEKMARAISAEQDGPRWWDSYTWGGHLKYKENMMTTARAVLGVLQSPTEAMKNAGDSVHEDVYCAINCYDAMIEAALNEKGGADA